MRVLHRPAATVALRSLEAWLRGDQQTRIAPDELLAGSVASTLLSKKALDVSLPTITTIGILDRLLGAGLHAEPEVAERIDEHFIEEKLFSASVGPEHYDWPEEQSRQLEGTLGSIRFLNGDGKWVPSRKLVTVAGGESSRHARVSLQMRSA